MRTGMIARTPRILLSSLALTISALLLLTGCEKDRDEPVAASSETKTIETTPRPEALNAAAAEIKSGKTAEAETRLEAFLEQEPKSVYRPEAHYLLGQALAAQGQYEDGKKKLDQAIDETHDRTLKALAMLGRADCNMALKKYSLASRQYHWLETMYRDVKALPQDEVMYKLGLACKNCGSTESADHWFKQVIELYATGPYAADAKREHSKYTPEDPNVQPRVYTLEVASFSKRQKADDEAAILREKGYRDVQVIETSRNSFPIYEVHVGKFDNKNAAIHAQTDAELAGLPTTIRPSIIEPLK